MDSKHLGLEALFNGLEVLVNRLRSLVDGVELFHDGAKVLIHPSKNCLLSSRRCEPFDLFAIGDPGLVSTSLDKEWKQSRPIAQRKHPQRHDVQGKVQRVLPQRTTSPDGRVPQKNF